MNTRILASVLALLSACAPSQLARQATRAAVDEGAEQLTKPGTQEELREAADDPKVQQATQNMSEQIAEGVLKAMESDRAKAQISAVTRGMTASIVQQMFTSLGTEDTRRSMVALADGMTATVLRQVNESFQGELRPTMQAVLREDVPVAIAAGVRDALGAPTVGPAARTVGYNLTMGANEGLGAVWSGQDEGSPIAAARALPAQARSLLWMVLAGVGLVTVLFLAGAAMLIARARQSHHEMKRLENATLLLVTAMREREASQPGDELLAIVEAALQGRAEKSGTHRIVEARGERKAG